MIMIIKIARRVIKHDPNQRLKLDKINIYKDLIKRKKIYYISRKEEQLVTPLLV